MFSSFLKYNILVLFVFFGFAFLTKSETRAAYRGQISFSEEEKQKHLNNLDAIVYDSAQCLGRYYDDHIIFFNTYGVSKYYGSRRWVKGFKPVTRNGRTYSPIGPELQRAGLPIELMDEMTHISCVELSLFCLEEGFENAGQADIWKKIRDYTILNGVGGTALQKALRTLGWKTLYWNPEPKNNRAWDAQDRAINPTNSLNYWGYHEARYKTVMSKNIYLWNQVDDKTSLVGFGTRVPHFFTKIPFFLGTAHAGYHVFPGRFGEVIEAHSTRSLFSIDNLEFSPFNPLESGGGPRWTASEKYRSGLITVPPGY